MSALIADTGIACRGTEKGRIGGFGNAPTWLSCFERAPAGFVEGMGAR